MRVGCGLHYNGTGKKLPVPVVDIDSAEQKAEDSILSHIQDTFTIAMAGDIMMGTTYPRPALPADEAGRCSET